MGKLTPTDRAAIPDSIALSLMGVPCRAGAGPHEVKDSFDLLTQMLEYKCFIHDECKLPHNCKLPHRWTRSVASRMTGTGTAPLGHYAYINV